MRANVQRFDPRRFLRANAMPIVAVVAALVTCFLVPPDAAYAGYIDAQTLVKLACMLVAVQGLRESGLLELLAANVVQSCKSVRPLTFALVGVTAVASMFVTNDMALLALLPLSAACLIVAGRSDLIAPTFVLQGLAANLCGMLLPFGNPQNIFLSGTYGIGFAAFVCTMAPPFVLATVLVGLACLGTGRGKIVQASAPQNVQRKLAVCSFLMLVACILAVVHVVPVWASAIATIALVCCAGPRLALRTNWGLVITFAAFFVFSGNLARFPAVQAILSGWLANGAFVPAALLSQVISNVPAAIVLSRFTNDWAGLLAGVNVGGAGTPIASLATLIVIAQYAALVRELGAKNRLGSTDSKDHACGFMSTGRFFVLLEILNGGFLAILLVAGVVLGW